MNVEPITLDGAYVRLEPLAVERHVSALQDAGGDASLFEWFAADYSTPEGMRTFVDEALDAQDDGEALPFATVRQETGEVIGSTRFCALRPERRGVEIGWTWVTPEQQRTPANTEAKFLMLRHAFEEWDCVRVEFETAAENTRARAALSRIGATEEGILRKHMLIHGEPRDSVFFSIISSEWDAVNEELKTKLDRPFP